MTGERPLETGWLPDTPVEDSLLRQFVFNQADANVAIALAGGGRVEDHDEVSLADSAGPVPYYNQAILRRPLAGPDDPVLDAAEAFFVAASPRPATLLSLWPTPDLSSRGWTLVGHPMLVARGPWSGAEIRPGDADLVVEIGPDRIGELERVVIEGYPMPEAAGAPTGTLVPPGAIERGLRLRLGLVDGEPVAAAAGFVAHGVVNLCLAATLPAARRRGVWGALVRARMADGPGLPAVAFTSDFSRPGFVHMGFLPIQRLTLWER